MPDKSEQEVLIPTEPDQIANLLAQKLAPIVQALDAIELPNGWGDEPSPAFRVLWRQ